MSTAILGEIRLFAINYAPDGWLDCNGQSLSVSGYNALFSLIGYTYGGSGSSFNLPDLRGRVALGSGQGTGLSNYTWGQKGGEEKHLLTAAEAPSHTHTATAATTLAASSTAANSGDPTGHIPANTGRSNAYSSASSNVSLNSAAASTAVSVQSNTGGGTSHENRPPYLAMRYCISVAGMYPMQP